MLSLYIYVWFVNLRSATYELHVSIFCAYCTHLLNVLFFNCYPKWRIFHTAYGRLENGPEWVKTDKLYISKELNLVISGMARSGGFQNYKKSSKFDNWRRTYY